MWHCIMSSMIWCRAVWSVRTSGMWYCIMSSMIWCHAVWSVRTAGMPCSMVSKNRWNVTPLCHVYWDMMPCTLVNKNHWNLTSDTMSCLWKPEYSTTQLKRCGTLKLASANVPATCISIPPFYADDGTSKLLRNTGTYLPDCKASYLRRK